MYRYNRRPTEHQKAAAHNLYANRASTPVTPDDWTPEQHAQFRAEAGLLNDDRYWDNEFAKREAAQERAAFAAKLARDEAAIGTPDNSSPDLRGRLPDVAAVRRYIEGGNATLTVVSKATGKRLTFKFVKPKGDQPSKPIWVRLLSGPNNEQDFTMLGTLRPENGMFPQGPLTYRHSAKSPVGFDAPSTKAALWLLKALNGQTRLEQAEVWHEGRCGRCGRKLTVPSSVESGFGPECINHV